MAHVNKIQTSFFLLTLTFQEIEITTAVYTDIFNKKFDIKSVKKSPLSNIAKYKL